MGPKLITSSGFRNRDPSLDVALNTAHRQIRDCRNRQLLSYKIKLKIPVKYLSLPFCYEIEATPSAINQSLLQMRLLSKRLDSY
jgi:hypothetical protein